MLPRGKEYLAEQRKSNTVAEKIQISIFQAFARER